MRFKGTINEWNDGRAPSRFALWGRRLRRRAKLQCNRSWGGQSPFRASVPGLWLGQDGGGRWPLACPGTDAPAPCADRRLAFRHKSRKVSFQVAFWLAVLLNVAALAWLVYSGGDLATLDDHGRYGASGGSGWMLACGRQLEA